MGIGLNSQIGIAEESTYGTPVAVTRFYEYISESLDYQKGIVQSNAIRRGLGFRNAKRSERRYLVTRSAGGDIVQDFTNKGMGVWLKHMLGGTPTIVQQGATTAWLQTHTPGDLSGKMLTVQKGVEEAAGTVKPFTFHGCKINSWELSVAADQLLQLSTSLDAEDVDTTTALATATYPAAVDAFHFAQGSLTVGGTAIANVLRPVLNGDNGLRTDAYFMGNTGRKAQPSANDFLNVTGTLDAEFISQAALVDRFISDASAQLVLTFTGSVFDGAHAFELIVTVPAIKFDGELPKVSGPGVVALSAPFTALWDGTNPTLTMTYKSTDATI